MCVYCKLPECSQLPESCPIVLMWEKAGVKSNGDIEDSRGNVILTYSDVYGEG